MSSPRLCRSCCNCIHKSVKHDYLVEQRGNEPRSSQCHLTETHPYIQNAMQHTQRDNREHRATLYNLLRELVEKGRFARGGSREEIDRFEGETKRGRERALD